MFSCLLYLTFIIDVGCSSTVTSSVPSPMQNSPGSDAATHGSEPYVLSDDSSQGSQPLDLSVHTTHPESQEVNVETTGSESQEVNVEIRLNLNNLTAVSD